MRPELLNPIFAEVTALKGIGPQLAKPLDRLGLHKVVDILFHLPTGYVDRLRVDGLRMSDAGRVVTIELTPMEYRASGGRGPFRVWAADTHGDLVALVYFGGNPGWAKKQLPLGEPRIVSGKLEAYGQELQIVHPDAAIEHGVSIPVRGIEQVKHFFGKIQPAILVKVSAVGWPYRATDAAIGGTGA
jgi:ATP-dependent DNA helicase RecG